ncbi:MAG: glutamate--cysteine ligase [Candidatus Endonucleobacter bathymodioli]|uniref:Glutamate--cysteine ligase n=1 Tax=Candidatus Endonucleibacter bathymodioli TaxID=539814 RepID=A0AA90NZG2_9GAMM|nr:glutamate--cysteine ligase [Candidatus Endonucleobacter bathymodioli]
MLTALYKARLELLGLSENKHLLCSIRHGIEREGLRVSKKAELSLKSHPEVFGKALTHPYITTDFSEALLEYITPVCCGLDDLLAFLEDLHRFTVQNLGEELLWVGSMPCVLNKERQIPIAEYGKSNIGRMKTVYRKGLSHRYGAAMQTIAGLHYNFSLPTEFWALTGRETSQGYLDLIRNFRRYEWFLMYLFGASPVVSKSFFGDGAGGSGLEVFSTDTLYLPYATSLRMSDVGYINNTQSSLNICYNTLGEYVSSLWKAIRTPYGPYLKTGVKVDGEYLQLNANLLQIENEYYGTIRPKRNAGLGERPITTLSRGGVEYIEVRCLDMNPFEGMGISRSDVHFLDVFLVYCALEKSNFMMEKEARSVTSNFRKSVLEGRFPGLLLDRMGDSVLLSTWGRELLEVMEPIAALMNSAAGSSCYLDSLGVQKEKLVNVSKTPSAQLVTEMKKRNVSYTELMIYLSEKHHNRFKVNPLSTERYGYFLQVAEQSKRDQIAIEKADTLEFDDFLQSIL